MDFFLTVVPMPLRNSMGIAYTEPMSFSRRFRLPSDGSKYAPSPVRVDASRGEGSSLVVHQQIVPQRNLVPTSIETTRIDQSINCYHQSSSSSSDRITKALKQAKSEQKGERTGLCCADIDNVAFGVDHNLRNVQRAVHKQLPIQLSGIMRLCTED